MSDETRELDAENETGLSLIRAEFIVSGAQGSRVQGIDDTGRGELKDWGWNMEQRERYL